MKPNYQHSFVVKDEPATLITELAKTIVENILKNPNGFTIDIHGKDQAHKKAYAISRHKNFELILDSHTIVMSKYTSIVIIAEWLKDIQRLLPLPLGSWMSQFNCIGGWLYNGRIYLDVTTVFDKDSLTLESAHRIARDANQIAFFDLETMTEITTNKK